VDLYSYDQTIVFAPWLPLYRDLLSKAIRYTPKLAEINAAWLRSDLAASNLLFAIND